MIQFSVEYSTKHVCECLIVFIRRGTSGMALSSRLGSSKRGSIPAGGNGGSGDDSTTQDETLDGDDGPN